MEMFELLIMETMSTVAAFSLPEVGEYVEGPNGLPIVGEYVEEPAPQPVGTWLWMACVLCVELSRVDCQHHIYIYIYIIYSDLKSPHHDL